MSSAAWAFFAVVFITLATVCFALCGFYLTYNTDPVLKYLGWAIQCVAFATLCGMMNVFKQQAETRAMINRAVQRATGNFAGPAVQPQQPSNPRGKK